MAARDDTARPGLPTDACMTPAASPECISLIPCEARHNALVRGWLARPECVGWWGTTGAAFARSRIAAESATAVLRIVTCHDAPIGYADALDVGGGSPGLGRDARPGDLLDPGIWDLAVFIGLEAHRGRGVGSKALVQLSDELFSTTLALGAAVRVPLRSERAARSVEAAGFHWQRIDRSVVEDPAWIFLRNRRRT